MGTIDKNSLCGMIWVRTSNKFQIIITGHGDPLFIFYGSVFNRRSRVRAVVTRGSTGLVGQNTSCKAHKVCISLWLSHHFELAGQER